MPFEPLETDELIEGGRMKRVDTDAPLIRGCMVFAVIALLSYGLFIWPFFLFGNLHLGSGVMRACLFAAVPTLVLGILACRVSGVPGASAFVAGSMMGGVFAYLMLRQSFALGGKAEGMLPPDYPEAWAWMIPLFWIVLVFVIAFIATPKHHYSMAMTMKPEEEDKA